MSQSVDLTLLLKINNELEDIRRINKTLENELYTLKKEIIENKSENSSLRGENVDLRNKIKILANNLIEYEKKNAELENRNLNKNYCNKCANYVKKEDEDTLPEYSKQFQENQIKIEKISSEIFKLKDDNKTLNSFLYIKELEIKDIFDQKNILMDKYALLSKTLTEKDEKLAMMKVTHDNLIKDIALKGKEIYNLNMKIKEYENSVLMNNNKDEELARLDNENKTFKSQINILKFINSSYKARFNGSQS
jgi:hypothetical protein